jgi:LAO/AO transport system kinase
LPAESIADRLLAGDPRAIARAISLVEDETPDGAALIAQVYPRTGHAYLIGVTGAPGSGKSTLVDRLAAEIRRAGSTVGIIAVDPSSPFTGGAILGDRVRMSAHAADAGVFIRSMATRGHLGGLARATGDVALILDAAGKDVIIIETVGVGQDEVEIVRTADVSIVLLVPGTGDDVQAIKAGIMEIADIFVVNKADREGADRVVQAVTSNLGLQTFQPGEWRPPVVKTEATSGAGIDRLWTEIGRYREHAAGKVAGRHRARQESRLRELVAHRFLRHVDATLPPGEFQRLLDGIARREIDPYSAAAEILSQVLRAPGSGADASVPEARRPRTEG